MRKINIRLTHSEAISINQLLEHVMELWDRKSFPDKCIYALIFIWRTTKVLPKTYFYYTGKASFKIDAPTGMALAQVISQYVSDPLFASTQAGNKLIQVYAQIDQNFQ